MYFKLLISAEEKALQAGLDKTAYIKKAFRFGIIEKKEVYIGKQNRLQNQYRYVKNNHSSN